MIEFTDEPADDGIARQVIYHCKEHDRYEMVKPCCRHDGTTLLLLSPEPVFKCILCWLTVDGTAYSDLTVS